MRLLCLVLATLASSFPFSCWTGGFDYEDCCGKNYGPAGNSRCWDNILNYEACCLEQMPTELDLPSGALEIRQLQAQDLQMLEVVFGGLQILVPVSESSYLHTGGDRMSSFLHNYAPCYARLFNKMLPHWSGDIINIAEVGILRGSGLAMWSVVFPMAQIVGFDYDTSNTKRNLEFLKAMGGFQKSDPELITYDQLQPVADNKELIASVLRGREFKLVIDDGNHADVAIRNTFLAFSPFLADDGLYIVEDLECGSNRKECWRKGRELLGTMAHEHGFDLLRCIESNSQSNMFVFFRKSFRVSVVRPRLEALLELMVKMDESMKRINETMRARRTDIWRRRGKA